MKYRNISDKVVPVALPTGTINVPPGQEVLASKKAVASLVEQNIFELVLDPVLDTAPKKRTTAND